MGDSTMHIDQTNNAKILATLIQGTHETFANKYPHYFKKYQFEDAIAYFEEAVANEKNLFYVLYDLYDGNEMVGFIWAYIEEKNETPLTYATKTLYIKKVVVHPNHRNRGYGQELIQYVDTLAQEKRCSFIEVELWYADDDVVQFLRKSNYDIHKGILWKRI